jgi:hypothetical protein
MASDRMVQQKGGKELKTHLPEESPVEAGVAVASGSLHGFPKRTRLTGVALYNLTHSEVTPHQPLTTLLVGTVTEE